MNLTFAAQLNKMITAGLGGAVEAPETGVAVGRRVEYTSIGPAPLQTFETNAELPLSNLKVWMEPIQDLHGQDAPYPAGGGKNKADPSTFIYPSSISLQNGVYVFSPITNGNQILRIPFNNSSYVGKTVTVSYVVWSTGSSRISFDGQPDSVYIIPHAFSDQSYISGIEHQRLAYTGEVLEGTTDFRFFRVSTGEGAATETIYITDIQIEESPSATDFAPYSNICPISGRMEVNVWREAAYDTSADPAITIPLGQTVYGGMVDVVSGVLTITKANIASYNGEEFPGEWISDRDVYAEGTVPTTGAQVVYDLASPVTVQLDPQQLTTLIGSNNVWSDGGDVSLTYGTVRYTEGY